MPEREATIVARYVGDVSDAKRAWDDLLRYTEANPLGSRSAGSSVRAADVATFSGGGGTAGTAMVMPASRGSSSAASSPGAAGAYSAVAGLHRLGGTGFDAPTGPVATASQNSVYGDLHSGVDGLATRSSGTPSAANYVRYTTRAMLMGVSPVGFDAYSAPGGRGTADLELAQRQHQAAIFEQQRREEIAAEKNAVALGPNLPAYDDAFSRSMLPGGSNSGAALSAADFSRGRSTLRSLNVGRSSSFLSSGLSALTSSRALSAYGGAAFTAASAWDRYSTESNEIRSSLRYDSLSESAESAYSAARSATAGQRLGGRIGNRLGLYKLFGTENYNDGTNIDDARDVANQARANAEAPGVLRGNRSIDRMTRSLGFRGTSAQIASAANEYSDDVADVDQAILGRGNANADDLYARRSTILARRNARIFQARDDYGIGVITQQGMNAAGRIGNAGNPYASRLAEIEANYTGAVLAFNKTADLLTPDERNEGRGALEGSFINQRNAASRDQIIRSGDVSANYFATRGRLGFNPYGGQRAGLLAQYNASLAATGFNPNSQEAQEALSQLTTGMASLNQQENLTRIDTSRSLGFESRAIGRMLGRDAVGANAFGIASSGIDRIQQLARGGFGDLAEQARQNTLGQLDVAANDYRFLFRATTFDARNLSLANPRDLQNPEDVFGAIGEARRDVQNAKANEGRDEGKSDLTDRSINSIGEAVGKAFQAIMTN